MNNRCIIYRLSVAEASEILCRLQEAEISVSVPECNKDVAEDNLREVCNIYSSESDYLGGWEFVETYLPLAIEEVKSIKNGFSTLRTSDYSWLRT